MISSWESNRKLERRLAEYGGEGSGVVVSIQCEELAKRFNVPAETVEKILDARAKYPRVLLRADQIGLPMTSTAQEVVAEILRLYRESETRKRSRGDGGWSDLSKDGERDGVDELTEKIAALQRQYPDATQAECVREAYRTSPGLWERVQKAMRARDAASRPGAVTKTDGTPTDALPFGDPDQAISQAVQNLRERAVRAGERMSRGDALAELVKTQPQLFERARAASRAKNLEFSRQMQPLSNWSKED